LDSTFLIQLLRDESEYVRSWAVRLLCEPSNPPAEALARFEEMAAIDDSAFVRLYLASSLQRIALPDRWSIVNALAQRTEDARDNNLPLMLWYGTEPLVSDDLTRFAGLASTTRIPLLARHVARRVASSPEFSGEGLELLVHQLGEIDVDVQAELLTGIIEGLEGRRSVAMPGQWPKTYARLQEGSSSSVRERSLQLALIFDDPVAVKTLCALAGDSTADAPTRNRAIQSLVAKRKDELAPLLLRLVHDPATRRCAIRGLAEYDLPETADVLLNQFSSFDAEARQDAVQTMASRLAWARLLIDAVEQGRIPRSELTAYAARQLLNLGDAELILRVQSVWGELRTTPAEKAERIADYKKRLTPDSLRSADRSAGRAIFQKTCASCHRLFDAGEAIGPDITGSQRSNLDYILQTLIDPGAAVSKDYQMQVFETTNGRVITGVVIGETQAAVTIQTVNEKIVVPTSEIEERRSSPLSLMPEGMLQDLRIEQVRELVAYLMSTEQVPLPIEPVAQPAASP
jgi:putative heme-binding domain-containing protein